MANAKANWGIIQIYDKTVDGEANQKAPTEAEIKNMLYQVIAAGAMGLFAYDYASLWHKKAKNNLNYNIDNFGNLVRCVVNNCGNIYTISSITSDNYYGGCWNGS